MREGHEGHGLLQAIYTDGFDHDQEIQLDGKLFDGMSGKVLYSNVCTPADGEFRSPVAGLKTIHDNSTKYSCTECSFSSKLKKEYAKHFEKHKAKQKEDKSIDIFIGF